MLILWRLGTPPTKFFPILALLSAPPVSEAALNVAPVDGSPESEIDAQRRNIWVDIKFLEPLPEAEAAAWLGFGPHQNARQLELLQQRPRSTKSSGTSGSTTAVVAKSASSASQQLSQASFSSSSSSEASTSSSSTKPELDAPRISLSTSSEINAASEINPLAVADPNSRAVARKVYLGADGLLHKPSSSEKGSRSSSTEENSFQSCEEEEEGRISKQINSKQEMLSKPEDSQDCTFPNKKRKSTQEYQEYLLDQECLAGESSVRCRERTRRRALERLLQQQTEETEKDNLEPPKKPRKLCTSADGPRCGLGAAYDAGLAVIPASVLRNVRKHSSSKNENIDVTSAEFNDLQLLQAVVRPDAIVRPGNAAQKFSMLPGGNDVEKNKYFSSRSPLLLPGIEGTSTSSSSSSSVLPESHIMTLDDARIDFRVPRTHSVGLPENTRSTWEGRWLVSDSGLGFGKVAELRSSVGYVRFSRPVIVRSLIVGSSGRSGRRRRRKSSSRRRSLSLVGGRRRKKISAKEGGDERQDESLFSNQWVRAIPRGETSEDAPPFLVEVADKDGVGLKAVDELFFLAADGLKVLSIEVVEAEGERKKILYLGR